MTFLRPLTHLTKNCQILKSNLISSLYFLPEVVLKGQLKHRYLKFVVFKYIFSPILRLPLALILCFVLLPAKKSNLKSHLTPKSGGFHWMCKLVLKKLPSNYCLRGPKAIKPFCCHLQFGNII